MRLIIGCGTGRCGTVSLTKLLDAQPGVRAFHEARQPDGSTVPWEPDDASEDAVDRACRLCADAQASVVADVAFWNLPRLDTLLTHFETARAVVLVRNHADTLDSFRRRSVHHPQPNRWSVRAPCDHPFHHCYPKYNIPAEDFEMGFKRYWHEYYARVLELQTRHIGRIMTFRTEWLPRTREASTAVRALLSFCGVGTHDQAILPVHENRQA